MDALTTDLRRVAPVSSPGLPSLVLALLLSTLALTLAIDGALAEFLSDNPWHLPYVGELPSLRGNDLSRLLAAASGFDPLVGAERAMPGEAVPYPPFAFLVLGVLALLPGWLGWGLFYLPALLQIGVADRFRRHVAAPGRGAGWFFAILLVYPFLYVLDRGNLDLDAGLLCFGAALLVARGRTRLAAVALSLAAALKIYPAVLLLLLARRDRRALALGFVLVAVETGAGLLVLRETPLEALSFLRGEASRTASCFATETLCLNLSAAVPFKIGFAALVGFDWYPALAAWAYRSYTVLSLLGATLVGAWVALRPARLWLDLLRLTLVMTLVPAMSYDYKLLLFLGPFYLAFVERRDGVSDRFRDAAILLMAVLLSSWKWLGHEQHLWIHATAQLTLAAVCVAAPRTATAGLRARLRFLRAGTAARFAATVIALALAWNVLGIRAARHGWAATTAWCPTDLAFGPSDPLFVYGHGWAGFDGPEGAHWRWTNAPTAALYLPSRGPAVMSGVVALPPGSPAGAVTVRVDAATVASLDVSAGEGMPFTLPMPPAGLHRVDFAVPALRDVGGTALGLVVSGLKVQGTCL